MYVKPLRPDLVKYLKKHNLSQKYLKQLKLFSANPRHPSLHTEILQPKDLKIYSFRIDLHYRAIFIFADIEEVEIVDINPHYE